MDPSEITAGSKVPIQNPAGLKSNIKCEVISKKIENEELLFYIHYIGLNRRYDRWVNSTELILNDPTQVELPKKKKKAEEKMSKGDEKEKPTRRPLEDEFRIRNIAKICIRNFLVDTWYFSPYPKDVIKNGIVYLCEFCLYYFSSQEQLDEHCSNCELRHPPGTKIYEHDDLSFFELDGYVQKNYCRNLALLSKLFLDHKSLYYDIDVFLFYVLCRKDDYGYQIVGYFSKEKISEQGYNLACILTMPYEQRKGYGKVLIDFSYMLSKKEKKIAGPEKPLSDLGLLSYRAYWLDVILEEIAQCKDVNISSLSKKTHITEEDIIGTLIANRMVKYYGDELIIAIDDKVHAKMLKGRTNKVSESFLLINC
ncbi:Histone acetyltransferase [Glugoides intestinalis]